MTAEKASAPPKPAEPETFTFKSKYREDKIALNKIGEKRVDGTVKMVTTWAEFQRNTWTTRDPKKARRLREIIKERLRDGDPIHVIETTNLK
jgi:hypothetical protein